MITPRAAHSAILLPDGRVLITGGIAASDASPELYDPSTGTFNPPVGAKEISGIATLLENGTVLITSAPAQIYDPVTDSSASTGSYVVIGPFFHPESGTLLEDRGVLVVGFGAGDGSLEREELYDPVTGTFKATGKPYSCGSGIGSDNTATLLPNRKVLLAGGSNDDCASFSTAELYDPSTDTFNPTGNMTSARDSHTATLLPDGAVLVAGGYVYVPQADFDTRSSAELYDPLTGTFAATANMTMARARHRATLFADGRVLLTGVFSARVLASYDIYTPGVLASAEIYTPLVLVPAPTLFSLTSDRTGRHLGCHNPTDRVFSKSRNCRRDLIDVHHQPV